MRVSDVMKHMTNRAPDVFHKIEVFIDPDRNYKQLLVDGKETWQVKDVSFTVDANDLAEVTVTFYTNDVTVTQASVPRDGLDA